MVAGMRRIHITGGPGTGKTRLASILSRRLGVDAFSLDGQALDVLETDGPQMTFEEIAQARLEETKRIAAGETWLTEGSNILVARPLLERAELVIVMHTIWRVAAYRILMRHVKASIARNNRFPSLRALWEFWFWSRRYYRNSNPPGLNHWGTPTTEETLERALAPFEAKVVRCWNDRDFGALISLLEGAGSDAAG